jgi:Type II CAAX prenyl endopeptidase Rce1-like
VPVFFVHALNFISILDFKVMDVIKPDQKLSISKSLAGFVLKMASLSVVGSISITFLAYKAMGISLTESEKNGAGNAFVVIAMVVIAPIIETYFVLWFVRLAAFLLSKIKSLEPKESLLILSQVIFAGAIFALIHAPFKPAYGIEVICAGWVFAYVLVRISKSHNSRVAFWTCSAVHAVHNAVAVGFSTLTIYISR